MKRETESVRKPEKLDQKFMHNNLLQGMLNVLDRRIRQCWEATPLQNHPDAQPLSVRSITKLNLANV